MLRRKSNAIPVKVRNTLVASFIVWWTIQQVQCTYKCVQLSPTFRDKKTFFLSGRLGTRVFISVLQYIALFLKNVEGNGLTPGCHFYV